MRGEGDCANIRRTRLVVFSLDEKVMTPEDAEKRTCQFPLAEIFMEKREWEGRASNADVQVRKVIQQALCEIWGVCEAMNVYLRGVFCCPTQWKGERKQLAHSQARALSVVAQ